MRCKHGVALGVSASLVWSSVPTYERSGALNSPDPRCEALTAASIPDRLIVVCDEPKHIDQEVPQLPNAMRDLVNTAWTGTVSVPLYALVKYKI